MRFLQASFWGTERFTIGNFTIPIVKRSFLKVIFIFFQVMIDLEIATKKAARIEHLNLHE